MVISHELRFVFFGIPRTANRAMHAALLQLPGAFRAGLLHHMEVPDECETYFRFCCVRNPYRRHLAYYLWRKQSHPWGSDASGMSFEQYIQACLRGEMGPCTVREHTGNKRVDQVIRYEDLPDAFHDLPIRGMADIKLATRGRRLSRHWRHYYNEKMAEKVFRLANADFVEFGYARDSWQRR